MFYRIIWIFVIYAFLGWCAEVIFAAFKSGKFVNRGFLNGPVCPIYGFGVTLVILCLEPIKHSLFLLFTGAFLLTTCLEFITGYLLEKIFHEKWWDYSGVPFNVKGYICLAASLAWGLTCVLIMRFLVPLTDWLINQIPFKLGVGLLILCFLIFLTDGICTLTTLLAFNKHLKILTEIEAKLKLISDRIGENLAEGVVLSQEHAASHTELKEKYEALRVKYEMLLKKKTFGMNRLLHAFPHLKTFHHQLMSDKQKYLEKHLMKWRRL